MEPLEMTNERTEPSAAPNRRFTAWMVVLWSTAGGMALGGFWVTLLVTSGRVSAISQMPVMGVFFVMGALLGLLHGALLGYFGRPTVTDHRRALQGLALGTAGSVPALAVAWIFTLWIGLTTSASSVEGPLVLVGIPVGWAGAVVVCLGAVQKGWLAVQNVLEHWSDARVAGSLLAGIFLLLAAVFLVVKPAIWWTDVRVSETGAVLLALGATVWIAGPLVVLTLKLVHTLPASRRAQSS